jgi:hypothetical protein
MRRCLSFAFISSLLLMSFLNAQDFDPSAPGAVYCEDPQLPILDDWYGSLTGTGKVLWVLCAPDSGALRPIENWSINRGANPQRVMYPSTYRMPWWRTIALDSTDSRSFTRYYKDQSAARWRVIGTVAGQTDTTIFLCDPDTLYRPRCPFVGGANGNKSGTRFFLNIMAKVDARYNLSDFDTNQDGFVDKLILCVYGLAEAGQFQGTGGEARVDTIFRSNDVNSHGDTVKVRPGDGITYWAPSEQALMNPPHNWAQDDAERESYWQNHNMAAHELGHQLGFLHTAGSIHNGLGNYDPMGKYGPFRDFATRILGPTSPYNPKYRAYKGWADTVMVDRPLFGFSLADHLPTSKVLYAPVYRNGLTQYFFAYASTRETVSRQKKWDTFWVRLVEGFGS